jgi:hypothetical protein
MGHEIQSRELIMHVADSMSIGQLSSKDITAHLESAKQIGINIDQKIIVPLKPILEVLSDYKCPKIFDFCSIDIEGSEVSVIADLLNSDYTIKSFLVETEVDSETEELLLKSGYSLIGRDNLGGNSLWILK